MFEKIIRGMLIVSGLLFWVIILTLVFPVSNYMGIVALLGMYIMLFGIPLAVIVAFLLLCCYFIAYIHYKIKRKK